MFWVAVRQVTLDRNLSYSVTSPWTRQVAV
jgi:hypothetical protein